MVKSYCYTTLNFGWAIFFLLFSPAAMGVKHKYIQQKKEMSGF
jgi:hypothetical protein